MPQPPEMRIFRFLKGALGEGILEGKPCEQIQLRQTTVSGSDSVLWFTDIDADADISAYDDSRLQEMANQMAEVAQQDADGLGEITTFQVVAKYKGENRPGKRSPTIRIAPDNVEDTGGLSEPANKDGVLKQLMRHNEAIMRSLIHSQSSTSQFQTRMLEVLSQAQIASQEKQLEAAKMIEQLQSEQHERDLATEEARRKAQQMQELLQLAKRYAPAVANHLLKGNVIPGATNPQDDIIANLLQEVSAEEAAEIYRVLGSKAAPLMDMYLQAHGEQPVGDSEDDKSPH